MDFVTVAVIGCGTIANLQHLPESSKNPRVKFKYAVDIILDRAMAAKEKYNIPYAVTDYKEVLKDKEVDAVMVLTPNYLHYTITMDALNAGKHVFCEKPITVNYNLSCEMAEAAAKKKLVLDIGVCNRYNRSIELIKQMIEGDELGHLYHVYCSFRAYRSIPGLGGDFTTKAVAGGGVLIDWGVHFIDLALFCMNLPKVKTVSANAYNVLGKSIKDYNYINMWAGPPKPSGTCDVEEFVSGLVRTADAGLSFNGAWAQNIDKEEMYVDFLGSKAGIRLEYGGKFTVYGVKNGVLETVCPNYPMPSAYFKEVDAFAESILTGKSSNNNIASVLETMKVLDAIYKSAEDGKEVSI